MADTARIFIVDDERRIARFLQMELEHEGFRTATESNGRRAYERILQEQFDLVLLDLMLPDMDGLEICKSVRKLSDVPIIMLTALGSESSILRGYELGCDDYVVKPFSLRHLYAKSLALLKRAKKSSDGDALRCGSISLNKKTMLVTVKGRETAINAREYFLLVYLLENKESVLTRQSILEHVWGDDLDVNDRVVDNTIRRLRECLGDASSQIKTVIGRGYRLTEE